MKNILKILLCVILITPTLSSCEPEKSTPVPDRNALILGTWKLTQLTSVDGEITDFVPRTDTYYSSGKLEINMPTLNHYETAKWRLLDYFTLEHEVIDSEEWPPVSSETIKISYSLEYLDNSTMTLYRAILINGVNHWERMYFTRVNGSSGGDAGASTK